MNLNIGNIGVWGFRHYEFLKQNRPSTVGVYASFSTREDMSFWNALAKECQEEFRRYGTEGKCIEARELIKLHVLESCPQSTREAAGIVAEGCGADVVSVIGFKFVLYRPSETKKKDRSPDRILLPK